MLAAAPPENFEEWYTPEATHVLESGTATDAESIEQPKRSSSEGEQPPPAKAQRPEGMPEAADGVGTYRPAPVEDDKLIAGDDGIGTGPAPEIEVDLELEYEDLNVDSNTWDVRTDSPEPHSPRQADALDCCVLGLEPTPDASFDVLREVPSTQPETPSKATGSSGRRKRTRSRKRDAARPLPASTPSTANVPPTTAAYLPPAPMEHNYSACLLYTSPSPRDRTRSRMPSSA